MSNTAQLSARERIQFLLDNNSFVEIGALVTKRSTDFNLQQKETPADGVITGYGVIDGNLVYVYSQDVTALGGTVGEMHAKKIAHIYDLAIKVGAPVIGMLDGQGIRLQESTDALHAFGEIYLKQSLASGVIPQITAVFGTCGGGMAVSTALSDFTCMTKQASLFINSPNTLDGNSIDKHNTSKLDFKAQNGMVDFIGESDEDVLEQIQTLITILPSNNEDDASYDECTDDLNRLVPILDGKIKDTSYVLAEISDDHFFMEVKSEYAKDMVTGFIRLNGMTVGAIANRHEVLDEEGNVAHRFDGTLTTAGCYKAEKFVTICDAFNIPILTLTDVKGFKATVKEERTIAIASAKLTYAFAHATVQKVNVIIGDAFGSAYVSMNSKHIGADYCLAWEDAKISMMDAKAAVEIMYADEIKEAADAVALIKEKTEEYAQLQSSAEAAARRGYVDSIIPANATRKHLVCAFEMLFTKRESRYSKKHGTV